METKRKLQLGAAAAVVNGILALTMSPSPALATSCGPIDECIPATLSCPSVGAAQCQSYVPPGCSYESYTCTTTGCIVYIGNIPVAGNIVVCNYT
jgi:hypothetical protein